jgi:hypothetical protein
MTQGVIRTPGLGRASIVSVPAGIDWAGRSWGAFAKYVGPSRASFPVTQCHVSSLADEFRALMLVERSQCTMSVIVWYLVHLTKDPATISWRTNHPGVAAEIIQTARH